MIGGTQILIPIAIKSKDGIEITNKTIAVSEAKNIDFAVESQTYEKIYRCYSNRVWTETFCAHCNKFLSNQNPSLSRHYKVVHGAFDGWMKKFNRLAMKLTLLHNEYISILDNPDFKALFPKKPICSKTLYNHIDLLYIEEKIKINCLLHNYEFLSVYFDEWTRFSYNFIGITASTTDKIFVLDVIVPENIDRTRDVLRDVIKSTLNYYKIYQKVVFQCTDCASNIKALLDNINWFPCCNHIINRCVGCSLRYMKNVLDLASRLSSLHSSCKFKAYLFQQKAKYFSFPTYSETRWYSLAQIFSRAIELKDIIMAYQTIRIQNKKQFISKKIQFFDINDFCLCDAYSKFFNELKDLMMDLEKDNNETIFWALSNLMTLYFDRCNVLVNFGFQEAALNIRKNLIGKFLKYQKFEFLNYLMFAAFLNPFLNFNEVLIPESDLPDNLRNVKKKFKIFLQRIAPDAFITHDNIHQQRSITIIRRGQIIEHDSKNEYKKLKNLKRIQGNDVLGWWECHKDDLPVFYSHAKKLSTLRATSCSVERLFSKGRFVIDDYSGATNPHKMCKQIMMYCNQEVTRNVIDEHEIGD